MFTSYLYLLSDILKLLYEVSEISDIEREGVGVHGSAIAPLTFEKKALLEQKKQVF